MTREDDAVQVATPKLVSLMFMSGVPVLAFPTANVG